MKRGETIFVSQGVLGLLCLLLSFSNPVEGATASRFLQVDGPCGLHFPRDHGAHPGYRTEWWYYTGNLKASSGRRFGFQLTFFRVQLSPPGSEPTPPDPPSAWRTNQLYFAHAALSDLSAKRFYHDERMGREALGLAGVEENLEGATIFIGRWAASLSAEGHSLKVDADDFSFNFSLDPLKPPVPHGVRGYSVKGDKPDSASCYYSFTRLATSGTVRLKDKRFKVEGDAWMDHEFSSAPLEPDLEGWDWFGIQLSNRTELMLYLMRKRRGGYSPASSGAFVAESGRSRRLKEDEFRVEVLDHWRSPGSSALYPSEWRIRIPSLRLELLVLPGMADQELETPRSTRVTYWEGSVSAEGAVEGEEVKGLGYVELTGYDRPFNLPDEAENGGDPTSKKPKAKH